MILIETSAGMPDVLHAIPDVPLVTIGSDAANHIVLQGPDVGVFHAVLMHEDGSLPVLCDQGCAAGVRVNGQVVEECELHHGDLVLIGGVTLQVKSSAGSSRVALSPPNGRQGPVVLPPAWADAVDDEHEQESRPATGGRVVASVVALAVVSGALFWWWQKYESALPQADKEAIHKDMPSDAKANDAVVADAKAPVVAPATEDAKQTVVAATTPPASLPPPTTVVPGGMTTATTAPTTASAISESMAPSSELRPLSERVWELVTKAAFQPPLQPLPTADGRIAKLDGNFATVVRQEAEAPYHQATVQLRSLYQQALERDMVALRSQTDKAADLVVIEREIGLLKNNGEISPGDLAAPPLLQQRRQTFFLESAKLEMVRYMKMDSLYESYARALTTYAAELSRQGRTEGARSIGELKRGIEKCKTLSK